MGLGGTFEESVTFQINPRITFTDMCHNFPALTKESLDYWVNSDPSISSVWDISNILLFSGNWTEIGNDVFNGFSKPAGYSLGVGYDRTTRDLGEILPESLKHIGIYAFNDVLDIDTLTFDNTPNLETIGTGAFANNGISGQLDLSPLTKLERIGSYGDALAMMDDLRNLDSQTIRTRDTCGTSIGDVSATTEVFTDEQSTIVAAEAVVSLGQVNTGAFQNNSFTSLNLSDLSNLKVLGTSTFEKNDMSGTLDLTSLTNLETISPCVFIHNKFNGTLDLSQLKKIKNIYEFAFAENLFDGSLIFGTSPSLESIGEAAFAKNKFTGELDLSPLKNLRSIGQRRAMDLAGTIKGVFQDNSFTSVNFTDLSQVTTIGNSAFENNNFSNGIDLSPLKKLNTIAPCAFENCVTQGPLIFGNSPSLEYIDFEAFVDNSFTGGLDLSGLTNLKKIGYDAFKSCKFSGSLNFKDLSSLEIIDSQAFADNSFTSISFENVPNLTEIPSGAFKNNNLSGTIDLSPLTKLRKIGGKAFDSSFENITKIIIPAHADTSFEIEPQNLKGSGFNGLKNGTTLGPSSSKTIYLNN